MATLSQSMPVTVFEMKDLLLYCAFHEMYTEMGLEGESGA